MPTVPLLTSYTTVSNEVGTLFAFTANATSDRFSYNPRTDGNYIENENGIGTIGKGGGFEDAKWHFFVWTMSCDAASTITGTSYTGTWKMYVDNALVYTDTNQFYPNIVNRSQNYLGL